MTSRKVFVLFVSFFPALVLGFQGPAPRLIGGTPSGPAIVSNYASFEGHAEVTPIVAPPTVLNLDPFYKKYVDAGGIPVVSSEKVKDDALLLARDIVNDALETPRRAGRHAATKGATPGDGNQRRRDRSAGTARLEKTDDR